MKTFRIRSFVLSGILLLSLMVRDSESHDSSKLDPTSEAALQHALKAMTNPNARNQVLQKDPKAAQADRAIDQFAGSKESKERIYQLAAEIFRNMVRNSNGDAKSLQDVLSKAQRDPASFANSLTPEQKRMLKSIGSDINSSRPGVTSLPR